MIDLKAGENNVGFEMLVDELALGEYTLTTRMSVPFVTLLEELDDCLSIAIDRAPTPGALWHFRCHGVMGE